LIHVQNTEKEKQTRLQEIAALKLQSFCRCMKAIRVKNQMLQQAKAVMKIQACWRCHHHFVKFNACIKERKAAIVIQKYWRGYRDNVDYMLTIYATIKIQTAVRRFNARKKIPMLIHVQNTEKEKQMWREEVAALKLQSFYRSVKAIRVKNQMLHQAKAVIKIQVCWRRHHHCVKYNACIQSIVIVQNAYRCHVALKLITRLKERKAAIIIQKHWRGYRDNVDYMLAIYATIKIQTAVRRSNEKTRVMELIRYLKDSKNLETRRIRSAILLQRCFRRFLAIKMATESVEKIQRAWRHYIQRRGSKSIIECIVSIQSLFRGWQCRLKMGNKVTAAASRIANANRNAESMPHLTLSSRTAAALFTLQTSTRLTELMAAVKTLEVSTRLSGKCCIAFVNANAFDILYELIRSCNRSLPHVELLQIILKTLSNVSTHQSLVPYIASEDVVDILLDLIQMFRDKESIFYPATLILEKVVFVSVHLQNKCGNRENAKRIKGVYSLCRRKIKASQGKHRQTSNISSRKGGVTKAMRSAMRSLERIINSNAS